MPALRASLVLLVAACTPRAGAPQIIEHPLGESTAPGPVTPPPLARDAPRTTEVYAGPLTGAPTALTPASSLSPGAVAPPTSSQGPAEAPHPAAAEGQHPVPAEAQYTGGTQSTVVQEPNARIPSTPSGVASETTAGTPSGVTPAAAEPSTPSGVPDTTNVPASTVPSGTPDVPATGVTAPPPPSEP
jgi:hypothetical protein